MKLRYRVVFFAFVMVGIFANSLFAGGVTVSWNSNTESDLQGYKIYWGMSSRSYNHIQDVGNTIECQVSNLPLGATYYFAVTAYDTANNESAYSDEVFITLADTTQTDTIPSDPGTGGSPTGVPPSVTDVIAINLQTVRVYFNQKMDRTSITDPANFIITPSVQIVSIVADTSLMFTTLTTITHQIETDYHLMIQNVKNQANVAIAQSVTRQYRFPDTIPPLVTNINLVDLNTIEISYSEKMDSASIASKGNYTITPTLAINQIDVNSTKTKVTLHTASHSSTTTYVLAIQNVKDLRGNKLSSVFSVSYSFLGQTPPKVVSIQVVNRTTIQIYYSERMDATSIANKSNYTIQPALAIYDVVIDTSLKKVTLLTAEHQVMVNYRLTIANVKDFSQMVISAPYNYDYNFSDNLPPFVEKLELQNHSRLKIYFSETMDSLSLKSLANYQIVPVVQIQSVQIEDHVKVVVLTTAEHESNIHYTLTLQNLCDLAQNMIPKNYALGYEFWQLARVDSISLGNYQSAVLAEGDVYYVDRNYHVTDIPVELQETTWIKTANNDKFSTNDDFLHFRVHENVTVYVGYDKEITNLPSWLQGWTSTALEIKAENNVTFHCYSKNHPAGTVVLGGNHGADDNNMYVVLVKSLGGGEVEYPDPPQPESPEEKGRTAETFQLLQNYPNPFNPSTEIPFITEAEDHVVLTIYDMTGRIIQKEELEVSSPGCYQFVWDGTNQDGLPVCSGLYLYRLQGFSYQAMKKMMLLR